MRVLTLPFRLAGRLIGKVVFVTALAAALTGIAIVLDAVFGPEEGPPAA